MNDRTSGTGAQERIAVGEYIIKFDDEGDNQSLAERTAYLISKHIKDLDVLEYEIHKEGTCTSKLMQDVSKGEVFIPIGDFLVNNCGTDLNNIKDIDEFINLIIVNTKISHMEIEKWIIQTIMFDRLIYNIDRHFNNFGLIINRRNRSVRLAPIFDNGASFFLDKHSEIREIYEKVYDSDLSWYIQTDETITEYFKPFTNIDWSKYSKYKLAIDTNMIKQVAINTENDDIINTILS